MRTKFVLYTFAAIITTLTLAGYYLLVLSISQAAVPIPQPHVPCDETEEIEFHSLRPYQASPCDPDVYETRLYCGMDIVPVEDLRVHASQGVCDASGCDFEIPRSISIQMDWDDSELPIAGQTQLVPNSNSPSDYLDPGLRMSEYVSWYLNGVTYRAEDAWLDMDDHIDRSKVVDFSGPIKKLLPLFVQTWARYDESSEKAAQGTAVENLRHDQIAGCTFGGAIAGVSIFGGLVIPCYHILINNTLVDVPELGKQERRLTDWKDGIERPKMLDEQPDGGYDNFTKYWEAYLEWRGKLCIKVPPIGSGLFNGKQFIMCIDSPVGPNWPSILWNYVPFSSTEDRKGEIAVGFPTHDNKGGETGTVYGDPRGSQRLEIQPDASDGNEVEIIEIEFTNEGEVAGMETLYFPHMKENTELAALLQETYLYTGDTDYPEADGTPGAVDPDADRNTHLSEWPPYDTDRCDLLDVRWNPGDDLFGEWAAGTGGAPPRSNGQQDPSGPVTGDVNYIAKFSCAPEEIDAQGFCTKKSMTAVSVYVRVPMADELWGRTVAGKQSIFQRLYPKLGSHGMFEELKDFPAVTGANYTSSADETYAGRPHEERPGNEAELYIPHLGGVLEYFLYGIQDALRPQFAKTSFPPGYPPNLTGQGPVTAQCKLGFDNCSVDYLTKKFQDTLGGSCGQNQAIIASQICQRESSSGRFARNLGCLSGRSYDFSLGYFQVNMVPIPYYDSTGNNLIELREGRCPGAFVTDLSQAPEPPFCQLKNPGSADCSDLGIPGFTACNPEIKACILKYWGMSTSYSPASSPEDYNVDWMIDRACGNSKGCTMECDWSPWRISAGSNACNPIP